MTDAGVVLIDKPAGPTSFQIIRLTRRLLGIKKVGHAGTLDPFASGLLVVCVGRPATRLIESLMDGDKEYEAVLQLGVETETQDPEGAITRVLPVPDLDEAAIDACLESFVGRVMQTPPRYSALKHKGKPLYHYARQGIVVEKEAREVVIHALENRGYDPTTHRLAIRMRCGRGTYVRALAADVGVKLGCGAHLIALRRTRSGLFSVKNAVDGALLDATRGAQSLRQQMMPVERFSPPPKATLAASGDTQRC